MASLRSATRLDRGRKAIKNTLNDPAIQAAVLPYGYDAAELTTGDGLLTSADNAVAAALVNDAAQKAATKTAQAAEKLARRWYGDYIGDARTIFPAQNAERAVLGIDKGEIPQAAAEFIKAATAVYKAAHAAPAEVKAKLAKRSWTPEKLAQAEAALADMVATDLAQQSALSQNQQATQAQNSALDALDAWVKEYRNFAKKALRGTPQALEALGIRA
jgi:hypothetical protein